MTTPSPRHPGSVPHRATRKAVLLLGAVALTVTGQGSAANAATAATGGGQARAAAAGLSAGPSASLSAGPGVARQASGTAVWESALEGEHGVSPDATVRQLARVSVGAENLRVRIGNPYGSSTLQIKDAWLGTPISPGSAALVPGSNRPLTFGGTRQVSIAAGQEVYSDPVRMRVAAQQDVAVSIYAPGGPVNDHAFPPFAFDPPAMYIGTGGDHAADPSATTFPSDPVITGATISSATGYHPGQVWWMDLVVGERVEATGTVVALGDSITDGYRAEGPPGQRWTDVLADRLDRAPARQRLAVANAGISGNTVSAQPNPYDPTGECCGPPAVQRLDQDVLTVPGVRTMLLLEGTNDLGGGGNAPPAPAAQVIDAMRTIVARAHAAHVRVVGLTVLPMCNPPGGAKEQARQDVNAWIRTSHTFDAVVDFDARLRDPADPTQMISSLRADCYHPNAAGDSVLGNAIPLSLLTGH